MTPGSLNGFLSGFPLPHLLLISVIRLPRLDQPFKPAYLQSLRYRLVVLQQALELGILLLSLYRTMLFHLSHDDLCNSKALNAARSTSPPPATLTVALIVLLYSSFLLAEKNWAPVIHQNRFSAFRNKDYHQEKLATTLPSLKNELLDSQSEKPKAQGSKLASHDKDKRTTITTK